MTPIYLSGVGGWLFSDYNASLSSNWTELDWTGTELGNKLFLNLQANTLPVQQENIFLFKLFTRKLVLPTYKYFPSHREIYPLHTAKPYHYHIPTEKLFHNSLMKMNPSKWNDTSKGETLPPKPHNKQTIDQGNLRYKMWVRNVMIYVSFLGKSFSFENCHLGKVFPLL